MADKLIVVIPAEAGIYGLPIKLGVTLSDYFKHSLIFLGANKILAQLLNSK